MDCSSLRGRDDNGDLRLGSWFGCAVLIKQVGKLWEITVRDC